jgi:hypothetical protein
MMGMGIGGTVGKRLAPRLQKAAPDVTHGFVREALARAIAGVGPLPPAAASAKKQLDDEHGNVDRAIRAVITMHVRYAGVQGFATNLGGLMTAVVSVPANITGLTLIELRMVAGIAHLRGYDLEDPRVRNAILVCLLGQDEVERLVRKKKLPAPPMALATAPAYDPDVERIVSAEVASALITRVAGKRLATTVGKKMPVVGGVVGMTADGFSTWRVGRYADRELLPRIRR